MAITPSAWGWAEDGIAFVRPSATDPNSALSDAIAALVANGGGTVRAPAGIYPLAVDIAADNVTIEGDGSATVLTYAGGSSMFSAAGRTGLVLRRLLFDGLGNDFAGKGAVHLLDCDDVLIEDVSVVNVANGAGVCLEGCRRTTTRHLSVRDCGYGYIGGAVSGGVGRSFDDNVLDGLDADRLTYNGVFLSGSLSSTAEGTTCTNNRVIDCTVRAAGDVGIESGMRLHRTLIRGCHVEGSVGPNILIRDNHATTVTANSCIGNTSDGNGYDGGIAILGQHAGGSEFVTLTSNVCEGNAGSGIRTGYARRTTITGNTVVGNARHGIVVERGNGTVCAGNHAVGNGMAGIQIEPAGSTAKGDVAVSGNVCANNGTDATVEAWQRAGIVVAAAHTTVSGNRCYDDQAAKSQQHGMAMVGSQADDITATGNDFTGNGGTDVYSDGAGTNQPPVP